MQRARKHSLWYRGICLCTALTVFLAALAQGSYAWRSSVQTAANVFSLAEANTAVRLTKYEQGTQTTLANAVYDLYHADGSRVPGRYTTDETGSLLIEGLAPGTYFLREVSPPYGYTFADTENRITFTLPENGELLELRAENRRLTADLTLQKEAVEGGDPAQEFVFHVQIGTDDASFRCQRYDAAGVPLDEPLTVLNGGTLTLRAGERAVFAGLPVGTTYAIYEESAPGYAIASTGASGTLKTDGSTAVFTNTQVETPAVAYGTLTITKQVLPAQNTDDTPENEVSSPIQAVPTPEADGDEPETTDPPQGTGQDTPETAAPEPEADGDASETTDSVLEIGNSETKTTDLAPLSKSPAEEVAHSKSVSLAAEGAEQAESAQNGSAQMFCFAVQIGEDPDAVYTYTIDGGETQTLENGGTLILQDGQSAVFSGNIPVGTRYTVTEQPAEGYATAAVASTGVMTAQGVQARFTNTPMQFSGTAVLRIHKELTDGKGGAFRFLVRIGQDHDAVYTYTVDGGKMQTVVNGGILELAPGQTAEFAALPAGIWYSVEELTPAGYQCVSQNATGTLLPEGCEANFVNSLLAQLPTGTLTIEKQVAGPASDTEEGFTFAVNIDLPGQTSYAYTRVAPDGQTTNETLLSGDMLQLAAGEKAVFADLPVGTAYRVVEVDCWAQGYVTTAEGSAGTIPQGNTTARFENRYVGTSAERETVHLEGQKTWQYGNAPQPSRPNSATIYVQLDGVTVAQQTITGQEGWQFAFDLPRFLADGTTPIQYTLCEERISDYETVWDTPQIDANGNVTQNLTNCYTGSTGLDPSPAPSETGGDK